MQITNVRMENRGLMKIYSNPRIYTSAHPQINLFSEELGLVG